MSEKVREPPGFQPVLSDSMCLPVELVFGTAAFVLSHVC